MNMITINPHTDEFIRYGESKDKRNWRLVRSTAQAFAMYLIVQVINPGTFAEYKPLGWTDNGKYANAVFNRIIGVRQ